MVADACNALLVLWVRVWLRGDSPWAMVREAQGRSADRVPRVCVTSSWSGICGATASGLKRCPLGDRYRTGTRRAKLDGRNARADPRTISCKRPNLGAPCGENDASPRSGHILLGGCVPRAGLRVRGMMAATGGVARHLEARCLLSVSLSLQHGHVDVKAPRRSSG